MFFSIKEWLFRPFFSLLILLSLLSVACVPDRPDLAGGDDDDSAEQVEEQQQDPNEPCEEGQIDDCESFCAPEAWLGDGSCDQAFNCEAFIYDYGDCFFES